MPYNRKTFSDEPVTETFYFPLTIQVEDEDCEDLFEIGYKSIIITVNSFAVIM